MTHMTHRKSILALALCGTMYSVTPVTAESLEEEEKWAKEDSYMQRASKSLSEICGISDEKKYITWKFDKASFSEGEGADWASHTPNGYCSGMFDNLDGVCRSGASGKKRVVDKVKTVVCKFGGKKKFALTLKGGTLTYAIDWNADQDTIMKALKKLL